ncbi:MAG: hypothetical protein C5B48_15830, partial [Candidatus Rokuibacteriota bacterium]
PRALGHDLDRDQEAFRDLGVDLVDPGQIEPPDARERPPARPVPQYVAPRRAASIRGLGGRVSWLAGLVLALSAFMGWYSGSSIEGPPVAVTGWNTGTLGKLVFFIGLAIVVLAVARELGAELPPSIPESLVVVALGTLATIFVLIRLISIPDTLAGTAGRGIGIWISLAAGVLAIVGGLARAAEEL